MWNALKNNAIILVALPILTIVLALFLASMLSVGGRSGQGGRHRRARLRLLQASSTSSPRCCRWRHRRAAGVGVQPAQRHLNGCCARSAWTAWPSPGSATRTSRFWCVMAVMVGATSASTSCCSAPPCSRSRGRSTRPALLDGPSRLRPFFQITVPLLWDTVQVAWVYLAILALDGFAVVQIMTRGGPGNSSDVDRAAAVSTRAFRDVQVRLRLRDRGRDVLRDAVRRVRVAAPDPPRADRVLRPPT